MYAAGVILLEFLLDQFLDGDQSLSLRITEKLATVMAVRKPHEETRTQLLKTEFGFRCVVPHQAQATTYTPLEINALGIAAQKVDHSCASH